MDIKVECKCGKELNIANIDKYSNGIYLIVDECEDCEKENYEAGEADAKQ